jgi:FkbM family methyltransferase
MKIGNRSAYKIISAPLQWRHYRALFNMFRLADHPATRFTQYLFNRGTYPQKISLRTPSGHLSLLLYCRDDLLTVNEIFFRGDYATPSKRRAEVIVDFGSNIGISAAYFLTHHPAAIVYLFEPLPKNIERLKEQLSAFESRYHLRPCAVATQAGPAQFGWEPTGRYGGVDRQTGQYISVDCVLANAVLEEIIREHGRIDILKIDIETMEQEIVCALPSKIVRNIETIHVETKLTDNPHAATHDCRRRGSITTLDRKTKATSK